MATMSLDLPRTVEAAAAGTVARASQSAPFSLPLGFPPGRNALA